MGAIRKEIFLEELPKDKRGRVLWSESIGRKVKFIYDNIEGELEIIKHDKPNNSVLVKYNNETFTMVTSNLIKCTLGKILRKITNEFKINIGQEFKDDKRDIIIINRKHIVRRCDNYNINEKHYEVLCRKCNTKYWTVESSIINVKAGCPCCAGKMIVKGVNDITTTNPELIKYFQGGEEEASQYTCNSTKKLIFKCPTCGSLKKKECRIYTLNTIGFSCDFCSDGISYPEKMFISLLDQLHINYLRQYSQEWSNNKAYDFFIPSLNMIIETHGKQHYEEQSKHSKFKRTLVEEQENDRIKQELALINGIDKYIVIDCRYSELEWIKNSVINSELSAVFDLSNVDWLECEKFALDSMVYKVGEYFSKHSDMTPKELSNIFNVTDTTIRSWLKMATKIGVCNYNPKKSNSIGGYKSWKTRRSRMKQIA